VNQVARDRRCRSFLFLNWRDPEHPEAGGAERYLMEVGRRLINAGHKVHWLTARFPHAAAETVIDGMPITRVGNRVTVYGAIPWTFLRRFRATFDGIVDAENGIPFFSPLYANVPIVCLMFHVHQRVFERHLPFPASAIFKWLEGSFMPFVYGRSRFVAISSDTKTELAQLGVPPGRITLAYSGYQESLVPGPKATTPTIIYLGRLKKYKRVDTLLRALVEIRKQVPRVTLVIAGTGDQEAFLRALSETLGVSESVRFEGFVSEDRKAELYSNAWVFAMASEMEGWGLTIIEANACGTPAVAVSVPGVREAIVDDESGILVRTSTELGTALVRVLTNSELRERLAAGGLRRAAEYTWERTSEAILEAFER
jgi:glycosyltransferase involved in cell wall biosynthesis